MIPINMYDNFDGLIRLIRFKVILACVKQWHICRPNNCTLRLYGAAYLVWCSTCVFASTQRDTHTCTNCIWKFSPQNSSSNIKSKFLYFEPFCIYITLYTQDIPYEHFSCFMPNEPICVDYNIICHFSPYAQIVTAFGYVSRKINEKNLQ